MVENIKIKASSDKELKKQQKRKNKLNSLKNEFEGGKIQSFDQLFAILDRSPLAKELNIPFYTFKKKVADPGEFTNNELRKLASLLNVAPELIVKFIFEQIQKKENRKGV